MISTPLSGELLPFYDRNRPDGSAASFLRATNRDEDKTDELLIAAIASSESKENKLACEAYSALPPGQRLNLLKAVTIRGRSPSIVDVRDEIRREVYHAAPHDKVDQPMQCLEGWHPDYKSDAPSSE